MAESINVTGVAEGTRAHALPHQGFRSVLSPGNPEGRQDVDKALTKKLRSVFLGERCPAYSASSGLQTKRPSLAG